jgi:hypothetical protein
LDILLQDDPTAQKPDRNAGLSLIFFIFKMPTPSGNYKKSAFFVILAPQ